MNDMRTDDQFTDDMDSAARALRAAAAGASMNGINPEDIARIVMEGIGDAQRYAATHDFRARADQIGHRPNSDPLPDFGPTEFERLPEGHGEPGDYDWEPPPIHPMLARPRRAA